MDETYFLYSEKGQRKIKDRKPRKRGGSAKKRGISNEHQRNEVKMNDLIIRGNLIQNSEMIQLG